MVSPIRDPHSDIWLPCLCRQITLNVNNPEADDQELRLITLDVSPDMALDDLRSAIEAEGIPKPAQHLYHNGELVTDNSKSLNDLQITDGDMLALHVRDMRGTDIAPGQPSRRATGTGGGNAQQDPETLRLQVLADPRLRSELERMNRPLAAALDDPQRFAQMFQSSVNSQEQQRMERMRQIEALNRDEFNPDSQAKIEEMIRQENVVENLQNAMEYNPECRLISGPHRDCVPIPDRVR